MFRRSSSPTPSHSSHSTSGSSNSSTHKSPLSSLPAIPDLRFEQSYLSTIRGFLHEVDKEEAKEEKQEEKDEKYALEGKEGEKGKVHEVQRTRGEDGERELWLGAMRVEWVPLLYVTVRDQILFPLIQGVTWGMGALLLGKFSAFVRTGLQESRERRDWQNSRASGPVAAKERGQKPGGLLEALGLTGARRRL